MGGKKKLTVDDFTVETVDGAVAIVRFGEAESERLSQADLHRIQKLLAKAVQGTY